MPECEQLDAHLNGDLTVQEATRFTAHLANCKACRTAVDQQFWIDDLLWDTATAEGAPAEVYSAINREIARSKQRRFIAGGFAALTAVASLLIALNMPFSTFPPSSPTTNHSLPTTPVATFVGSDDMIVVHHDSPYPNVTIVEVYPTITARRRWQSEPPINSFPSTNPIRGDQS